MPENSTVEVSSNGKRYAKLSLMALGSISSIVSVIIFLAGFIIGFTTFKADINVLTQQLVEVRADNKELQNRLNVMNQTLIDDRGTITNRLTNVEVELKYISQGVAELKLANVPKR